PTVGPPTITFASRHSEAPRPHRGRGSTFVATVDSVGNRYGPADNQFRPPLLDPRHHRDPGPRLRDHLPHPTPGRRYVARGPGQRDAGPEHVLRLPPDGAGLRGDLPRRSPGRR